MNRRNIATEVIEMRSAHASLRSEIAAWRDWWQESNASGQPRFRELGNRLTRFRRDLKDHFDHEESLVGIDPPEVCRQLSDCQQEHAAFLMELDELIQQLTSDEGDPACWNKAGRKFLKFLDGLDRHESAERDLWDDVE